MDNKPRFPLEIFSEIIRYVSYFDHPWRVYCLDDCACVSRAFWSLVRYHQHRTTKIVYDYFERDLAFFRFLAPHLGSHVRTLTVEVGVAKLVEGPGYFAVGFEPFSRVRSLLLESYESWTGLSWPLRVGLGRLVATQSLRCLHLCGWALKLPDLQDLKHLLWGCADRLEELFLESMDFNRDVDSDDEYDEVDGVPEWAGVADGPVHMPRLKTLKFRDIQNQMRRQNFLSCPALSSFDTELAMDLESPYIFPPFLPAESLQHLVIRVNTATTCGQLDKSLQPAILSLMLKPDLEGEYKLKDALTWLTRFFGALPCRKSLQRINISISDRYRASYHDCLDSKGCDSLSILLRTLVGTGGLIIHLRYGEARGSSTNQIELCPSVSQMEIQERGFVQELLGTGLMTIVFDAET